MAEHSLMPGPEGKTPRFYEVDRGHKTESYITAVSNNPVEPKIVPPKEPSANPIGKDESKGPLLEPPYKRPNDGALLTEQDLKQYEESSKWKALRWILFVLFWLLWIAIFLAVLFLIFSSPGCAAKIRPNWWQTAVAYNVWVPSFQDSDGNGVGDMRGLIDRLEMLRKSGVQTLWPSPFLISDDFSNAIRSFDQMDPELGVNQLADELIEKTHEKNMKLVVTIPIATTSLEHDWFIRSAAASKPENKNYSMFYHWSGEGTKKDDFHSQHKGLFYAHEKENPKAAVLNFQNSNVRTHVFEALSRWIDRGVDGFHLTGIEYLARTTNGLAPNWPAIFDILRDLRHHIDTYVSESAAVEGKKIALFAARDEAKEKDKREMSSNGLDTVINYELSRIRKNSQICHKNEGSVATCVHEILSDVLLFHSKHPTVWPHWEFGNAFVSRVATRAGSRAHAELLMLLQLILPGTNSVYYGDEIGMRDLPNDTSIAPQRGAMQWDEEVSAGFSSNANPSVSVQSDYKNINWQRQYSEDKSPLKMFSRLAKLRQREETLMSGTTIMGQLVDGGFTITRFLQRDNTTVGNIYVAAMNFAEHETTLPLLDLPSSAKLHKCTVVVTSSNSNKFYARQLIDLSSKNLKLDPEEGIIFRYSA